MWYHTSLLCGMNTCQLDHTLGNFASHLPVLLILRVVHKKNNYLNLEGGLAIGVTENN